MTVGQSGAGPLHGVRVVEIAGIGPGPFAAMLLADLGADVLKVEPPGGEGGRRLKPFKDGVPGPERSGAFLYLNTGKRSITLDLREATGRDRLLHLVDQADVLVENFAPRVLPALGLDIATLHERNPRLVVTSISNFGQTGPYRDYAATEIVSFAMGGLMDTIGFPEDPPLKFAGIPPSIWPGWRASPERWPRSATRRQQARASKSTFPSKSALPPVTSRRWRNTSTWARC